MKNEFVKFFSPLNFYVVLSHIIICIMLIDRGWSCKCKLILATRKAGSVFSLST